MQRSVALPSWVLQLLKPPTSYWAGMLPTRSSAPWVCIDMHQGSLISIPQIGYASMNAIGPETYHGQHRGTGTSLQAIGSRLANIIVSLLPLFSLFLALDDGNRCLGSSHRVVCGYNNGGPCLHCWCFDDLHRSACLAVAIWAKRPFIDLITVGDRVRN